MEKVFNWICLALGVIGGFLAEILGGWDKALSALVCFAVIDYLTGIIKGIYTKNLSSEIGFKGIIKKIAMFAIVAVGFVLQNLTNNAFPIRDIVVYFYIANEGLSILENVAVFLPLPNKLKDLLLQIREKSEVVKQESK